MRAAGEGLSGIPDRLDGRIHGDPPGPDVAAPDPCNGHSDQRSGASTGKMVQPPARLRLPDLRGRHPRHLRAYGNVASLRDDRTASRPVRVGTLRTRLQGHDGGRNPARDRLTRAFLALINDFPPDRSARRGRCPAPKVWYLP